MYKMRIKKQIFTHIPVYSGDVSGAASALYEFGGITVIHDPSGCNSTYNTFDELRWTKRESAVYISGLRESDAINGNDQRLIDDTCDAVAALSKKPEFISLCNSPVPDIIGTDFNAICRILETRTGIPAFYVQTNAMHDYTVGGANAFLSIAEKFLSCDDAVQQNPDLNNSGNHNSSFNSIHGDPDYGNPSQKNSILSVNLLGLSPFEYPSDKQVDKLYDILEGAGFSIAANWGKGTAAHPVSFSDVKAAVSADVSLVLSSIGLKAAQFLYERFGIPYVIGNPLASDEFASIVFKDLKALEVKNSYLDLIQDASSYFTAFVGEPVTMGSEAAALRLSSPETSVSLICTTELNSSLISPSALCPRGEAEIAEALKKATVIYGDPLFKNTYSHGTPGFDHAHQKWIDEPHLAMSGRLFADKLI